MSKTTPHITAAELKLLKVLWSIGPGTVRDVIDAQVASGISAPAYTTVMTLMNQLAEKGALDVDRQRQPFVYKTAIRRDQVMGDRISQFVQTVFDGQAGELVLRLVEQANLSPDDLKRIEAKIDAREQADDSSKVTSSSRKGGAK